MKKTSNVFILLLAALCLASIMGASDPSTAAYREEQTVEMYLEYICPVAFKETGSWHLAGPKTFWLQTKVGGDSTQFRFFQVLDSDLISNIPRDSLIERPVGMTVCFIGDPDVRNPFAVCELLEFTFCD